MTVAFAIPSGDDIVITADTLETDDYMKDYQAKVIEVGGHIQLGPPNPRPDIMTGWCAIAGAGSGDYVDALIPRLADAFLSDKAMGDGLRRRFEEVMKEFHADHIAPINEKERPKVNFLIGLQRPNTPHIFVTEQTTVRIPLDIFGAIGYGATFATSLLRRLWTSQGLEATQVFAAYVAFRTKQSVQYCGGDTTITTVHGLVQMDTNPVTLVAPHPHITRLPVEYVRDLERIFQDSWANEERNLIWDLVSKCPGPPKP